MNQQFLGQWYPLLEEELNKDYFIKLKDSLRREYTTYKCCPAPNDIFKAFELCPPEKVRAIMMAQDPYPYGNHAHGLAFSTLQKEIPFSLRMIYREVDRDVVRTSNQEEFLKAFPNGDLTPWAKKGIFLINTCLTVRSGTPTSHKGLGWEEFTNEVLRILWKDDNPKVFMLWGKSAQDSLLTALGGIPEYKHMILEAGHPASGSHGVDKYSGCNHFSKANRWFQQNNLEPINWRVNE